jgi:hypothetical protein
METLVGPGSLEPVELPEPLDLPPQPVRTSATRQGIPMRAITFRTTMHPKQEIVYIWQPPNSAALPQHPNYRQIKKNPNTTKKTGNDTEVLLSRHMGVMSGWRSGNRCMVTKVDL